MDDRTHRACDVETCRAKRTCENSQRRLLWPLRERKSRGLSPIALGATDASLEEPETCAILRRKARIEPRSAVSTRPRWNVDVGVSARRTEEGFQSRTY